MPDVYTGAAALQSLLTTLAALSEEGCREYGDLPPEQEPDGRDYCAMVAAVAESIARNLHERGPAHREGYLRALADLLCMTADGCGPCDDWDPIANTAAAFIAPAAAQAAIQKAAQ